MPLDTDKKKADKCTPAAGQLLLKGAGVNPVDGDFDPNFMQLVLQPMQSDAVSTAVKSDSLILLLGKSLFDKLGRMKAGHVRSHLRNLARQT